MAGCRVVVTNYCINQFCKIHMVCDSIRFQCFQVTGTRDGTVYFYITIKSLVERMKSTYVSMVDTLREESTSLSPLCDENRPGGRVTVVYQFIGYKVDGNLMARGRREGPLVICDQR
jgi:hypothetical protein